MTNYTIEFPRGLKGNIFNYARVDRKQSRLR